MVFKTRLGYRKTISGRIRGTGKGRIYIKVGITPFNVFSVVCDKVESLDFNVWPIEEHLLCESLSETL